MEVHIIPSYIGAKAQRVTGHSHGSACSCPSSPRLSSHPQAGALAGAFRCEAHLQGMTQFVAPYRYQAGCSTARPRFVVQVARRRWHGHLACVASGYSEASAAAAVASNSSLANTSPAEPAASEQSSAAQLQQGTAVQQQPKPSKSSAPQLNGPDSRLRPTTRPLFPGELRPARGPCPQCGGAGSLPGPQGAVPCTACQLRRRREGSQSSAALLGFTDPDLPPPDGPTALPKRLRPLQQQALLAPPPSLPAAPDRATVPEQLPERGLGPASAPPSAGGGSGAAGLPAAAAESPPPPKRRENLMTEEKREAIRRGALKKGMHSPEHRR